MEAASAFVPRAFCASNFFRPSSAAGSIGFVDGPETVLNADDETFVSLLVALGETCFPVLDVFFAGMTDSRSSMSNTKKARQTVLVCARLRRAGQMPAPQGRPHRGLSLENLYE